MMDREEKVLAYVQGRMSADDKTAFETEIAGDTSLSAEIAALKAARKAFSEIDALDMPDVDAGWAKVSASIAADIPEAANQNRGIRLSLAQAAGIAIAAVALWQVLAVPMIGGDEATFVPAGIEADAPILQVVFRDDATLGEVTELLGALDGVIVSGPGALGLYRVAFVDEAARAAARDALAERADLIAELMSE